MSLPEESSSPPKRTNLVKCLENQAWRRIEMEMQETDSALSKCHPQQECPLFTIIPRELRDLIFQFALAPYEDKSHEYKPNEFYYRPGHTARLKTDTALLLTCRRIWLEANAMPMLQAEHCFWYHRAAPDRRDANWMAALTTHNCDNFGDLHLFAQMYKIETLTAAKGALRAFFLTGDTGNITPSLSFQPKTLHVTIRHTDWWYWETEEPLRIKLKWVHALLNSPDLRSTQTLKIELETLDYKRNQLDPIVEDIKKIESTKYESHLVDNKPTSTYFQLEERTEVSSWSGPIDIDGETYPPYAGKKKLDYYVVTLTWRLRFPDLPPAQVHVPTLRRAPRIYAPERKIGSRCLRRQTQETNWTTEGFDQEEYEYRRLLKRAVFVIQRKFRNRGLRAAPGSPAQETDMFRDEQLVLRSSDLKAKLFESDMRLSFNKSMSVVKATEMEQRWKAENSLLMFTQK